MAGKGGGLGKNNAMKAAKPINWKPANPAKTFGAKGGGTKGGSKMNWKPATKNSPTWGQMSKAKGGGKKK